MKTTEFDEIRPYYDEELPKVYDELAKDSSFKQVMALVYPNVPFGLLMKRMYSCKTVLDFQKTFCYEILDVLAKRDCESLRFDCENLPKGTEGCLFISNHRDIVLDSAFLSYLLMKEGLNTVEEAIGDNLLIYPWIKHAVRINRSFIVQRAISMKEMINSSKRLSHYINDAVDRRKQYLWIAQREGRAKDSDDRTQLSLLKMLTMWGEGSIMERLLTLRISPLSLSYEYDSCDYLKAKEFQEKRDDPSFKKSPEDDLLNMQTGLSSYKGNVFFKVGRSINSSLEKLDPSIHKKELLAVTATLIDDEIHRNYYLYPINYVAYDLLNNSSVYAEHYSQEERLKVEAYFSTQLDKIVLPNKDTAFLRRKMLEMYANPLINYMSAWEKIK
ncbi:MAG: 1-acyl-sn-glycerol-3-phosphate acyltransferase [Bacteroidaceae bacterium]|nr:1-acyl-sn-glycerol-3-phosphate acyltransferase [Bacteroidaceae bacterium]